MCFSSLPVLSMLLLNHNRLADVSDMQASASASSCGVAASQSSAASTASGSPGVDGAGGGGGEGEGEQGKDPGVVKLPFESLTAISLSGNRIEEWSAVDRLSGLPALRSLRFSGNPVTSGLGASEARAACIARLSQLERVNGSECSARERRDAEKLYLRSILTELAKVGGDRRVSRPRDWLGSHDVPQE
ncbi:unnamed protein product [Sphacelaria rigidula]